MTRSVLLLPALALFACACEQPVSTGRPRGRVTIKDRTFTVDLYLKADGRRHATVDFRTRTADRGYLLAWPRPRFMKLETARAGASFDVFFLDEAGRVVDESAFIRGRDEGIMPAKECVYALFLPPGTTTSLGVGKGATVGLSDEIRAAAPEELTAVRIGEAVAWVELARVHEEREHGLMFRPRMSENDGMLFVYEDEAPRSFWMMNTLIPLDLAFFTSDGTVLNVNETPTWPDPRNEPPTHPHSDSQGPARCVLEMNLGWFRKHGLIDADGRPKPGIKAVFPPEVFRNVRN